MGHQMDDYFSLFHQVLNLLPEYSMLVGGMPGSRRSPAEPQREEAQREHEDCGKASRQRTVYGEVWYDHNNR